MSYGGLGYVIPHKLYPAGYHCKPEEPLPFGGRLPKRINQFLPHGHLCGSGITEIGLSANTLNHSKQKLDMGKSCIRFKKMDDIPYKLIGELMKKMTAKDWIAMYEKNYVKKLKK